MSAFQLIQQIKAHSGDIKNLSSITIGDLTYVATCGRDGIVKLWKFDIDTCELGLLNAHSDHTGYVNSLAFGSNYCGVSGIFLASGGSDKIIYIYDVEEWKCVGTLIEHTDNICNLSFTQDGCLISSSWDKTAIIWKNATPWRKLKGHDQAVWCAAQVGLDYYLTASADKTVRLWNGENTVRCIKGHWDVVRSIAILESDLCDFATVSNDQTLRLWKLGGELQAIKKAHDSFIYDMDTNGCHIATVGEDGQVKIWKYGETVLPIWSSKISLSSLWSVSFVSENYLVCGDSNGYLHVISSNASPRKDFVSITEMLEQSKRTPLDKLPLSGEDNQVISIKSSDDKLTSFTWREEKWVELESASEGSVAKTVQIELDGQSEPVSLKFNDNDDPYELAQDFAIKHNLPSYMQSDLLNFLIQNTKVCDNKSSLQDFAFTDYNNELVAKKMTEFSEQEDYKWNKDDRSIDSFIQILNKWSPSHMFPVFDTLRIIALENIEFPVTHVIKEVIAACQKQPMLEGNFRIAARLLCNLLNYEEFRKNSTVFEDLLADFFDKLISFDCKDIRLLIIFAYKLRSSFISNTKILALSEKLAVRALNLPSSVSDDSDFIKKMVMI